MMENTERHMIDMDSEIEIDLRELFYLFRRKIIGIIACFIVGGLVTGLFTYFFVDPKYEATSRLYIVSASNDSVVNLADLQIGASLTNDYEELVLSRPMLESVIQNLSLDIEGTETLKNMIEISNPKDTRILNITVTSTVPQEAADIANEMATLAITWLPEVMESNTPNIAEEAIVPVKKSSPSYAINTIVGAIGLAAVYMAIITAMFLFDDTIRSDEEFERYFGIIPLTSIPEDNVADASVDKDSKTDKKESIIAAIKGKVAKR